MRLEIGHRVRVGDYESRRSAYNGESG